MNLKCTEFSGWNDDLFSGFIGLKHELQKDLPTYFPETLEDYRKVLHPESAFAQDYEWRGFQIHEGEKLVAKAILAWRRGQTTGNLGYIDWINDEAVAKLLVTNVRTYALMKDFEQIKCPVDLNFFVKYRIRCPGGGAPYYGEPIYPDYYHELFEKVGFEIIGTWDTFLVDRFKTIGNFFKKRKKLNKRRHAHHDDLKVRFIKLSDWDNELKVVHGLFLASFKDMPEFEPITYEQFKLIYDDFKYLIHPLLSYIVEFKGVPVGFSINYPDPLQILSSVRYKKLSVIQKGILLARLKLNCKTLLMPYMGKTTGPNGEEVKGIMIKITKLLSYGILAAEKSLSCYQSTNSPAKRPLGPELITEYAKYVLYGIKLKEKSSS